MEGTGHGHIKCVRRVELMFAPGKEYTEEYDVNKDLIPNNDAE